MEFCIHNFIKTKKLLKVKFIFLLFSISISQICFGQTNDEIDYAQYRYATKNSSTYQVIFDVEDPCFEILSGNWELAKTGSYIAYYYYTINGPGDGSGKARWITEGLPSGNYLIEYYINYDNYPDNAQFEIISSDGITTKAMNMNYVSAGWYSLGNYNINKVGVVNISDYWSGVGTKMTADALRFTFNDNLPTSSTFSITPHIGVCIDDAGQVNPTLSTTPIYKMLRLPYKMTYAVMPSQSYTAQTADEIFSKGSEVILHQPMAAITVPNPGAGGITDSMTIEQVKQTLSNNLSALPHAVGMNNHMGSLITQRKDKMQACMEVLKEQNKFFYDSRTITVSVGYDIAKQNGLLTGERDLFIDGNSKDEAKELIRNLAMRAFYSPTTTLLAIGHVRATTADALSEMVPELQAMGVELCPISKCLAQIVETDFQPKDTTYTVTMNFVNDNNDCYSKELYDGYSKIINNPSTTHSDCITFTPNLQLDGLYDIYLIWTGDSSNAPDLTAVINHNHGVSQVSLDQTQSINEWYYIGRYPLSAGSSNSVMINDFNSNTPDRIFRADAVKFVYIRELSSSVKMWMLH